MIVRRKEEEEKNYKRKEDVRGKRERERKRFR